MAQFFYSQSKMGLYRECPLKYKFRYILKIPEKPKYFFSFGTILHSVMEYLYSAPQFPPIDEALQFYKQKWSEQTWQEKGYASAVKEQEGFLEGQEIIKKYYQKHFADNLHPLSTEMKVYADIDGLTVMGIVDRIDYLGDGKIAILDYKTGKTLKREPDQLMFYQKLLENSPKLLPLVQARDIQIQKISIEKMLFYHLPTLTEDAFKPVSADELNAFWKGAVKTAENILAQKFEPTPSEQACKWCDYRGSCPVWNLTQAEPPKAEPQKETLTEKIDRLGKLSDEGRALKAEIIKELKAQNQNLSFGTSYKAELKEEEVFTFKDEEKTIQFLKQNNLLNKTLKPTVKSILALLDDPTVTLDQKQQLRALASKDIINKLSCVKTED
ncbi:MAG: PD-(D/E)XK nuclease family protein [Elusimicrobiaceae bacterium]|nr:PD-(D/E)XK nuclease family protein [Elusimicrobiaceae bacterium]